MVPLVVLLDHRRQLPLIAVGVGHVHAGDDPRVGGRGQLYIECRAKTAIAHLHHAANACEGRLRFDAKLIT